MSPPNHRGNIETHKHVTNYLEWIIQQAYLWLLEAPREQVALWFQIRKFLAVSVNHFTQTVQFSSATREEQYS